METEKKEVASPIVISPDSLSELALKAVLESYILREGTDYGIVEISLEQKVLNLRKKIERQDIVLVFDPETESLNFLTQADWRKRQPAQDEIEAELV